MVVYRNLKIFTGNANPPLSREIAQYLGVGLGDMVVKRFSDGEINVAIEENVRGSDVFLIQPTCYPVNENMMELLLMIDAFRRASARRITAVIPYYGYARQERKTRAREPISAKLAANLIVAAGARRVLAMDLHAGAIQGFFDIPMDHLPGVPILARHYQQKNIKEKLVVVSPDIGGVTRARSLAGRLGADMAIIDKRRIAPNSSEIMHIIGPTEDRVAILIDDIVDTGGTMVEAAEMLDSRGTSEVYACCTHPVLSGSSIARLKDSRIKELVVTNTIPLSSDKKIGIIKVLSVAELLGEAIIRIHEDMSVSKLFDN